MKRWILLILCIIVLFPVDGEGGWIRDRLDKRAAKHTKYELTICAVFQNEAPWLKEWIEYHHMLGVNHFVLFNDRSDDNCHEVLAPYIRSGLVELHDKPCPREHQGFLWTAYQRDLYCKVVDYLLGVSRWVALIDIDEFIVPMKTNSLIAFLRGKEAYGGVYIRWENFGTNFVERVPEDKLMVETLTRRQPFVPNQGMLGKSIVQPHLVAFPNIHSCGLRKGSKYWDSNEGMWEEFPEIKIFHYWTRDIHFLLSEKKDRAERIKGQLWTKEKEENYIRMYNDVEDLTMERFVPELRRRVFGEVDAGH